MTFLNRIMLATCLVFSLHALSAQAISWQDLGGPFGVYYLQNIAPDGAGGLFMHMNGQIYHSIDEGDHWLKQTSGLSATLGSRTSKFFLTPSGTVYAYFNNSSDALLYRYLPANKSWAKVTLPFGNFGPDGVDIDPQGRIWVSAYESNSVVYYSTNGGQTFQQVTNPDQTSGWFENLATFNDDHNLLSVGYGANKKVYHFNLSGTLTQVISGRPLKYLGYNPYTGTAFFCDTDGARRSVDGGLTWQTMSLDPGAPYPLDFDKMFFDPGGRIYAQSDGQLYFSDNEGLSWAVYAAFSGVSARFFPGNNQSWFATNTCSAPQFSRSTDLGASWTDLSKQFQHPTVREISKDGLGQLYAKTCSRSGVEYSTDEGQNWADLMIPDAAGTPVLALQIATRPDGLQLAVGADEKFYRSMDHGVSWSELTTITSPPFGTPSSYRFLIGAGGACYFLTPYTNVQRSQDNGSSWQELPFSIPNGTPVFHPNGDIFWVDLFIANRYVAATDLVEDIQFPGTQFFDNIEVHCTPTGILFFAGVDFTTGGQYRMFRMLNADGTPEEIQSIPGNILRALFSNVEGDVYLVQDKKIYKSEDAGTSWTTVGAVSVEGSPVVYVSADQYLYLGYPGAVIQRSVEPLAESNTIAGRVWLDTNGDCSYDAGEALQPFTPLTTSGAGQYTAFSGFDGQYTLRVPSGAFALNVQPPNALFAPCFTDVPISLNGPNDSAVVDMPLRPTALCPYLSVSLSAPLLRRCFEVDYRVHYKNEGTAPAPNASVTVTLDSLFVFQSAGLPVAAQNGLEYTFELGTLAPGQSGVFELKLQVSCAASLGQTHCIRANIFPNALCLPALQARDEYLECRENIGSFDPNDKRVFVNGQEEPGQALPDTELEYLIRFQNTGTDTAFRVVVEDRLPAALDLSSMTPVAASHPYTVELLDQRRLRFVFDNIHLPDSNINEAASHGYIKFRVAQQPGLPIGTTIRNEAAIFFDFNDPVHTNTSSLVIGTVYTHPEPDNPYRVTAWPNPFSSAVSFELEGPALNSAVTLRLFDALGQLQVQKIFEGNTLTVPRAGLVPGLYYFLIESEGRRIGAGKVLAR